MGWRLGRTHKLMAMVRNDPRFEFMPLRHKGLQPVDTQIYGDENVAVAVKPQAGNGKFREAGAGVYIVRAIAHGFHMLHHLLPSMGFPKIRVVLRPSLEIELFTGCADGPTEKPDKFCSR